MPNPLKVSLENIIPLTEARDHFSQIVNEVQKDKLYVLTKGGKPAVAIVDVKYLEAITGGNVNQSYVKEEIKKAPEKVGLAPMIEHKLYAPPITAPVAPSATPPVIPSVTPPAPKPFTPPPIPKPITPPSPMTTPNPTTPKPPPTVPPASPASWPASPPPTSTVPTPSAPIPVTSIPPTPTNNPVPIAAPIAPANTGAVIETNTNPFLTKPPENKPTPIAVNFSPDYDEKEVKNNPSQTDPEDKPGPAQYIGSSTAAGADANKEPDDMAID